MSAGRDFVLFVLFLVGLGIVWFLTGGPERAISHAGWFLNPPAPLGNGEGYGLPSVPLYNASSTTGDSSSSNTSANTSPRTSIWDYFFNYHAGLGETLPPTTSPYAQYVSFSAGSVQGNDPDTEYVVLRTNSNLTSPITITGWSLESAQSGTRVQIGNAAQIPFLGGANVGLPVTLGPQSSVALVTGHSPNGVSFRENKCTGYFNQFQHFVPQLAEQCPKPEDELLQHPQTLAGNTACDDFVRTLPQCRLVVTQIPGNVGGTCQDFILNTLSYNGCVQEHQNDPDFYRNSWRVYLNRDQELWANNHDAIRLLDENGKLVGQISY